WTSGHQDVDCLPTRGYTDSASVDTGTEESAFSRVRVRAVRVRRADEARAGADEGLGRDDAVGPGRGEGGEEEVVGGGGAGGEDVAAGEGRVAGEVEDELVEGGLFLERGALEGGAGGAAAAPNGDCRERVGGHGGFFMGAPKNGGGVVVRGEARAA